MTTVKKVLFYSRDPGGTNCIIPVYQRLRGMKGMEAVLWGKDFAIPKYREEDLKYQDVSDVEPKELFGLLKKFHPSVLVTGTSYGDRTEQLLWKWAKELGVYSMAILDQWLSYRARFSDPNGRLVVPDKILVMDEFAKREMIAEGFDQRRILVTGQPHFEALRKKAKKITEADKKKIRKDLNIQTGITILFVSEPFSTASRFNLGFTEHTILRDLVFAIQQVEPSTAINLLVKLHPKQKLESFRRLIRPLPTTENIHLSLIADFPVLPLILVADIVIGMQSMVLIEANLLKKPVMSLQIGRKGPDQFILSKRGIIEAITTSEVLKKELRKFFLRPGKKSQKTLPVVFHPVENVKRFIISAFDQQ